MSKYPLLMYLPHMETYIKVMEVSPGIYQSKHQQYKAEFQGEQLVCSDPIGRVAKYQATSNRKRPANAGKPAKGGKMVSMRFSQDVIDILAQQTDKTAFVEQAIREKNQSSQKC